MKTLTASWFLIAVAACSSQGGQGTPVAGSAAKPVAPPEPTPSADVTVELAAVTLADDCGAVLRPLPSSIKTALAPSKAPADAPARVAPAAPCPVGAANCGPPPQARRACEQTSMQLAIRSTGPAAKVEVKKVELLDAAGTLVAELAIGDATRFTADAYEAWDEQVAAGQVVAASYALAAPPYHQLKGGRWEAHNQQFQLRVTVVVAGKERTVEKTAISPAMMEPAVPT